MSSQLGSVLCVIPYSGEADAVAIANDSIYGLSGSVWTADMMRGIEVARRVRTGNCGVTAFGIDFTAPFVCFKESSVGRQLSPENLDAIFEFNAIHLPHQA